MEERYIASVDLGSSKIALTVAKVSGNDIQVIFYREKPSQGIRNSAVFNPQKAAGPIKEVIAEAESELSIKILQVVVGLPRCDVRQEINCAKVTRNNPDESISAEEVEALKSIAREQYPLDDPDREQIYGAIAQSYSEDENFQLIESDIIGVISETFEGNFKLFIGKRSSVKTIDKVFSDLEIAISRKYFTPGAIAKAVLTEDEMENGVALVDLGGGATSVSIYKGKILRHYACIPFGGKVITSDIRSECSITETLAENIKMAFGACQPDRLQNLGEKILQIEGDVSDVIPGMPVHVWHPEYPASTAIRRMVKSASGSVVSIYGEWPEGFDFDGKAAACGAIRWSFTSPEFGLSGDYDRNVKLEAFSIAHGRAAEPLPVDVKVETIGEMSDRVPDSQKWRMDFSERTLSRFDGKATGLRGASMQMTAEGPHAPALIKAVRVETVRAAR